MPLPPPKLDLFTDHGCLVSKKSRTSTPSLKPPKRPIKSCASRSFSFVPAPVENVPDSTNAPINTPNLHHNITLPNNNLIYTPVTNHHHNHNLHYNNNNNNILNNNNNSNCNNNHNVSLNLNPPCLDNNHSLNNSNNSLRNKRYNNDLLRPNHAMFNSNCPDSGLVRNQNIDSNNPHLNSSANFSFDQYSRMCQRFEIIAKIGSGHFADVYKAKSLIDGQYYAIKKTSIPYKSNSDRLRKLQEVKNHQSVPPHPNCVRYYDSWEEDGYLYIQTELCKTSLNETLEAYEDNKLPEHTVWKYLVDLLLAVKHLHDHDLLHLDIKPDNIFISFDGVAKLGDFGIMYNCLDLNSSIMNTSTADNTANDDTNNTTTTAANTTTTTIPDNSVSNRRNYDISFFHEEDNVDGEQDDDDHNDEDEDDDGADDDHGDDDNMMLNSTPTTTLSISAQCTHSHNFTHNHSHNYNRTRNHNQNIALHDTSLNLSLNAMGDMSRLHSSMIIEEDDPSVELDDSFSQDNLIDHDDSGITNRSDESIDSIDEGDSKYLASETMQGKFTKAADIFSLGITTFEVASGLDLPQRGSIYHKLRHNEIDDLYFNGLSSDLVMVIKMMMEEDYTKRPTVDYLLQLEAIRMRGLALSRDHINI